MTVQTPLLLVMWLHWLPELWTFKLQVVCWRFCTGAVHLLWCFCRGATVLSRRELAVLPYACSNFQRDLWNGTGMYVEDLVWSYWNECYLLSPCSQIFNLLRVQKFQECAKICFSWSFGSAGHQSNCVVMFQKNCVGRESSWAQMEQESCISIGSWCACFLRS